MVIGMATTKITITLPDRQLKEIRKRVATHKERSVSGFIQDAVQQSLDSDADFSALIDEVLERTGGPLTPKERAWAKKMLTPRKRATKSRKAA
jgi:Arc/MetJ-type ribon-helix-helix transcriptional regulator